jgi:hypothetical protein
MRLIAMLVVLAVLGVQEPDYVGPEDPAHEGQPRTCSNHARIPAVKQDCKCEKKTPAACNPEGSMEDRSCYVYCRKPACRCHHPECHTE